MSLISAMWTHTLIPAGKFVMGSPATEAEREAGEDQHEVAITRPFYLGVHTVTQGQFEKVMGKNPSFFNPKKGGSPDHPAEQVRWGDAREVCTKLSALPEEKKAGRTYRDILSRYYTGTEVVRLFEPAAEARIAGTSRAGGASPQ